MTERTIAYGVRPSWSGKRTTVVRVIEREETLRIGDLCGTRRVRLHRGIQSLKDAEMAARVAQDRAARENVPYVGYKADSL
jgi:hypothetical protein